MIDPHAINRALQRSQSDIPNSHWRSAIIAAWILIGAVSAYDAWLVKLNEVCILDVELNPIAWYLIKMDHGDVTRFLLAKMAGTVVVLLVLAALYEYVPRLAYPVTGAVSTFQMSLLLFLHLA